MHELMKKEEIPPFSIPNGITNYNYNSISLHSIVRNEITTMCCYQIKAPFQPCISNSDLSVLCNTQYVFNTNNEFIGAYCIYTYVFTPHID